MRKNYLLLLVAAVSLILFLTGCGSQKESAGNGTGEGDTSAGEAVTEEAADESAKEFKWLNYNLKLEELREMNDSDHFSIKEPPEDSRYIVTKFVASDGEIRMDDITKENTGSFILKDSGGNEYEPGLWVIWGVEYDASEGFSTKDMQEGFNLIYLVPKSVELEELSLELK